LQHGDPALTARTWQNVMELIASTKKGSTLARWQSAIRDKAFDIIRDRKLIETTAEHFLTVLKDGTVATNVYLCRARNYALDTHFIPWPVLPRKNWPQVQHKEKRAITLEEHQKIINREYNPATRAFYDLLWHLGGPKRTLRCSPLKILIGGIARLATSGENTLFDALRESMTIPG
jgi:hypothetical protein